jgi:hypothetical protein
MSDVVNAVDMPDVVAGEYVLGTLDSEERSDAQSLLAADAEFAAKVKVWERRLGELHLMVEPVEPDAAIWERIKAKLPEIQLQTDFAEPQPAQPQTQFAEPQPTEAAPAEPAPAAPAADDASARLEAAIAAISEAAPAAETPASEVPAVEPSAAPSSPDAAPLVPAVIPPRVVGREERLVRRQLGRWRVFAVLMMLLVVAMAALIAAWRFAPDRVPPALEPVALLRLVGVNVAPPPAAVRRPLPPQSEFDE